MNDSTQLNASPPRETPRTRGNRFRAAVAAAGLAVLLAAPFAASSALAQDGTWDASWTAHDSNQKGIPGLFEDLYSLGGGGSYSSDMTATSTVVQPDGKMLVAGFGWNSYNGTDQNACIVRRYYADGSVDSSFGNAGSVVENFSASGLTDPKIDCYFDAMALQPDGKIVVVGEWAFGQAGVTPSGLVMRFNADGSLDGSFGDSGGYSHFVLNFTQVLVLGSGEIAVVGTYHFQSYQDTDFYLGILDSNGHLQYYRAAHFDLGGDKNDTPGAAVAETWFTFFGSTFHTYDEIYLAGVADNSTYPGGLAHHTCALAAFRRADNDAFAIDTTFGGSGVITADFPVGANDTDTICRSAARRPALSKPSGIVIGGERYWTPNNGPVGSASNYALDEIDANGVVTRHDENGAFFADVSEPGAFNSINSMVWDNLGKLVTVGYAGIGANGDQAHAPSDGVIRRFNADYSLDMGFADHSTLFASLDTTGAPGVLQSQREWLNTVATDPLHGRIVFAGERSPWLAAFPNRYAWFLGAVHDGNVVVSDRIFANGFD